MLQQYDHKHCHWCQRGYISVNGDHRWMSTDRNFYSLVSPWDDTDDILNKNWLDLKWIWISEISETLDQYLMQANMTVLSNSDPWIKTAKLVSFWLWFQLFVSIIVSFPHIPDSRPRAVPRNANFGWQLRSFTCIKMRIILAFLLDLCALSMWRHPSYIVRQSVWYLWAQLMRKANIAIPERKNIQNLPSWKSGNTNRHRNHSQEVVSDLGMMVLKSGLMQWHNFTFKQLKFQA